ncbi:hypothetical protein FOZ60_006419 [Perkinsus olseni]|uniref:Uncharacterized protein n=1 Tax=Perkinsus olseni TaxID=32597 RepID=A0A7J6NPM6_PEROL|nr:hypothetical protein FOZ60_006419 [Perkinsus olseni]
MTPISAVQQRFRHIAVSPQHDEYGCCSNRRDMYSIRAPNKECPSVGIARQIKDHDDFEPGFRSLGRELTRAECWKDVNRET